jgi:HlyD family secretion protein
MRNRIIFIVSGIGVLLGLYSAYVFSEHPAAQKPFFEPAANPYANGIYAKGIVESAQSQGENTNIYPEVSGPIVKVLVAEGQVVQKGDPLLQIDDTVQHFTFEQQKSQAEAALATLEALKAQPRPENLRVAEAQVENAKAVLKNARDQMDKWDRAYASEPETVSRLNLDNARNATLMAETNLAVVQKQYELTKSGAWSYDVRNQEKQYGALQRSAAAAEALLEKYTLRAPADGVVFSIRATVGSYVSPQGAFGTYTGSYGPLVVMGSPQKFLAVRAYVDEILVHRLPPPDRLAARMYIQGTTIIIPLTFDRIQPYVTPKIELADQRQERVDVRVLPVIFRFEKPKDLHLYPGQLVDVYIGEK